MIDVCCSISEGRKKALNPPPPLVLTGNGVAVLLRTSYVRQKTMRNSTNSTAAPKGRHGKIGMKDQIAWHRLESVYLCALWTITQQ